MGDPFGALTPLVLLSLLFFGLASCSGKSTIRWKEEVKLNNGKIIVIERESLYIGGGDEWASNRFGGRLYESRIRITMGGSNKRVIHWVSTKRDAQTYPEGPLVFDVIEGVPVVFTLLSVSPVCDEYSKYMYNNGIWQEVQLPELFEPHSANLLYGSKRDLPDMLTLLEKNKRNGRSGYRKALKQVGPSRRVCGE